MRQTFKALAQILKLLGRLFKTPNKCVHKKRPRKKR